MILFTGQAFQMPIINDLKVHEKILNQQVFWNLTFSHAGVILTCVYLSFHFFLFLAVRWVSWGNCWWGIKCAEIYASRPDHLIIFSTKLFSQPDYFLSQIIRWPPFLLAAASMLGGNQTVCTMYFFLLICLSYKCPSKCEIPTKWTISPQTR